MFVQADDDKRCQPAGRAPSTPWAAVPTGQVNLTQTRAPTHTAGFTPSPTCHPAAHPFQPFTQMPPMPDPRFAPFMLASLGDAVQCPPEPCPADQRGAGVPAATGADTAVPPPQWMLQLLPQHMQWPTHAAPRPYAARPHCNILPRPVPVGDRLGAVQQVSSVQSANAQPAGANAEEQDDACSRGGNHKQARSKPAAASHASADLDNDAATPSAPAPAACAPASGNQAAAVQLAPVRPLNACSPSAAAAPAKRQSCPANLPAAPAQDFTHNELQRLRLRTATGSARLTEAAAPAAAGADAKQDEVDCDSPPERSESPTWTLPIGKRRLQRMARRGGGGNKAARRVPPPAAAVAASGGVCDRAMEQHAHAAAAAMYANMQRTQARASVHAPPWQQQTLGCQPRGGAPEAHLVRGLHEQQCGHSALCAAAFLPWEFDLGLGGGGGGAPGHGCAQFGTLPEVASGHAVTWRRADATGEAAFSRVWAEPCQSGVYCS